MRHGPFLFNPAEASTAQLDAVFVGRDALLQTILEDLRKQRQSPTTQHFLVIGPRGTGKTHLTELLARRLADAGEFPWRTVRLPEEGGFDGLAAVLGEIVERDLGIPRNWDAPVPPVEVSVEMLVQRRAEIATPLLVIMENLPTVLASGLRGDQEINHFRALLMNDPPFTLLATAPRYFEEIGRENRPLYDFFRVFTLHELKSDEIEELVLRRAKWDGIAEVLRHLDALKRRVRTLYHFTGGNPRLALAFYEVLRGGVSEDIHRQFPDLLDWVTPYYQLRLQGLSPQQRLILRKLATAPTALAPAKLGKLAGISTSHTTAVLSVLLTERFVRRLPAPRKGRNLYALSDRFFRLWLELRERTDARKKLRCLLDFYRAAYGEAETINMTFGKGEKWLALVSASAQTGDPQGFVQAAREGMSVADETQKAFILMNFSSSLRFTKNPEEFLGTYRSLFSEIQLSASALKWLFSGLWRCCEAMKPSWTAAVVRLFSELGEETPAPWVQFAEFVEKANDFSTLDALHPEIGEGVELLLKRHGMELGPPPMMR